MMSSAYPILTSHNHLRDADRKSTRLNSSHLVISYAVFCLNKKINEHFHLSSTLPCTFPPTLSIYDPAENRIGGSTRETLISSSSSVAIPAVSAVTSSPG